MDSLKVGGLVAMPPQVPAWIATQVGKQGTHAHLVLRIQEHELCLAVFERHRVVGLDLHRSHRIAAAENAVAHDSVIPSIEQCTEYEHGDKRGFHVQRRLYAAGPPPTFQNWNKPANSCHPRSRMHHRYQLVPWWSGTVFSGRGNPGWPKPPLRLDLRYSRTCTPRACPSSFRNLVQAQHAA